MLATPEPSVTEADANTAFDALLWALSRPGIPRKLPSAGEACIIRALLDRECRAHSADPLLVSMIMQTGAEVTDIDLADHVFLGAAPSLEAFDQVALGSDLYPDDGATVFVRGRIAQGPGVRMRGPGVDGSLMLQLSGLPNGFWQRRTERLRYPMGFDLFILDGAAVVGIPRSTEVEVV